MRPIDFPESNIIFGKDQPPYAPLPALFIPGERGVLLSCFDLSEDEIAELINTKKLWVTVLTFGQPLQPLMVSVEKPELADVIPEDRQPTFNFDSEEASKAAKPTERPVETALREKIEEATGIYIPPRKA